MGRGQLWEPSVSIIDVPASVWTSTSHVLPFEPSYISEVLSAVVNIHTKWVQCGRGHVTSHAINSNWGVIGGLVSSLLVEASGLSLQQECISDSRVMW